MGDIKNILLITFDQWRGDCLSALGHPVLKTPVFDALAKDAVLFSKHYSTAAPCAPARASLLTGMYQQNHRVVTNGAPLDERFTNVALEARKLGYDPALFGYTDTPADPRGKSPSDPRLASYEGVLPGMTQVLRLDDNLGTWFVDLAKKGYRLPDQAFDIFLPRTDYPGAETRGYTYPPPVFSAEDSNAMFLTNEALDYIEAQRGAPWFAHLSYITPHPPIIAPEPYNTRYDPAAAHASIRAQTPDREADQHPFLASLLAHQARDGEGNPAVVTGRTYRPEELDGEELAQIKATYFGMVNQVEDCLGKIITHLKTTGAYEETLIVVTSDHGEMLGDHWLQGKSGYFDTAVHIPLIIRDPRASADRGRGQIITDWTESVDVAPTILSALGAAIPRQMDGSPLSAFLKGERPTDWRDAVHHEYDFRDIQTQEHEARLGLRSDECSLAVLRDDRFKYVHFAALPPLFFDLEKDPEQLHNCAEDPAYAALVRDYAQKMLSWRMMNAERAMTYDHIQNGVVTLRDDRFD